MRREVLFISMLMLISSQNVTHEIDDIIMALNNNNKKQHSPLGKSYQFREILTTNTTNSTNSKSNENNISSI
jgi:hypothetical protein